MIKEKIKHSKETCIFAHSLRTVGRVGAAELERNRGPAHVLHRNRPRERVQVRVGDARKLLRQRAQKVASCGEASVGAPTRFGREAHEAPVAAAAAVGLGVRTARVPRQAHLRARDKSR